MMIEKRERALRLGNLNMMVGAFYSEAGTSLLRTFSAHDPAVDQVPAALLVSDTWSDDDFTRAFDALHQHIPG